MIDLGPGPHLLLDDVLVRDARNLGRRAEVAQRHPANPLLRRQHPWEAHAIQAYGNVLHDDGRFRFWYFAAEQRDPADVPWPVPDRGRQHRLDSVRIYNICHAESDDGVAWRRTMASALPFPPYDAHNIVIADMHSACVVRDDDDPKPRRRYKALGGRKTAVSPDGLHWETRPNPAVGKNDTGSSLVRWRGQWLAFVRQQTRLPEWPVVRAVGLSTSGDFDTWTPKATVLTTDAIDGHPFTQPYGLTVFPRGDLLVGLLWLIVLDREETGPDVAWRWNNRVGDVRMEWVCSHDGSAWTRVADRAEALAPEPGAWDGARVWPATSVLVHGGRTWLYYSGADGRHGVPGGDTAIGLATWPEDRLVALVPEDGHEPAVFTTPPLRHEGRGELLLNACGDGGPPDISVAALAEDGAVIPGFDAPACSLTRADALRWRVRWQERSLASSPSPCRLRLTLRATARLYAMQLAPIP